jgi:hypothetical protein
MALRASQPAFLSLDASRHLLGRLLHAEVQHTEMQSSGLIPSPWRLDLAGGYDEEKMRYAGLLRMHNRLSDQSRLFLLLLSLLFLIGILRLECCF